MTFHVYKIIQTNYVWIYFVGKKTHFEKNVDNVTIKEHMIQF